jgi:hypothetical protein
LLFWRKNSYWGIAAASITLGWSLAAFVWFLNY